MQRAHGVVVSHPLRMRKALGSNPSGSMLVTIISPGAPARLPSEVRVLERRLAGSACALLSQVCVDVCWRCRLVCKDISKEVVACADGRLLHAWSSLACAV